MPIEDNTFATSKPQFNALNGEELRHVILRELDAKLSTYDDFRQHLTYSKFMYIVSVDIAIDAYPQTETLKVKTLVQGQSPAYEPKPGTEPKRHHITFGTDKPVTKPDLVRQEAGLAVPKTTPTPDGQLVDRPVITAAPEPTAPTPPKAEGEPA